MDPPRAGVTGSWGCLRWAQGDKLGFLQKQYTLLPTEPPFRPSDCNFYREVPVLIHPALHLARKRKPWSFCHPTFQQRGSRACLSKAGMDDKRLRLTAIAVPTTRETTQVVQQNLLVYFPFSILVEGIG